jgi:hypothetical protein
MCLTDFTQVFVMVAVDADEVLAIGGLDIVDDDLSGIAVCETSHQ